VAADPERLPSYRELGVTAISPAALGARRIELSLETRRVTSMAFAHGRAEAAEFNIAHDSPMNGKRIMDLPVRSWVVGAILRGDELIVPHGNTVLAAGDLVTVMGAGADFADMVKTFTSGESRFPLEYGKCILVALEDETNLEGPIAEAIHLARHSRASSITVVHRDPAGIRDENAASALSALIERTAELADGVEIRFKPVSTSPFRALVSLPLEESIGVIVVGVPERRTLTGWRTRRAASLVRRTGRPVLLSRTSHPYRRIVVPARQTPAGRAAVRAAIDLARFSKGELQGAAIVDPVFISGPVAPVEARRAISWLEEEAAIHGIVVEGVIRRGNPVRQLLEVGKAADLVVLGVPGKRHALVPHIGVGRMVAQRAPRSVLLVPAWVAA
jgi:nucleotide-binding universal stress UspA family protein